MAMNKAPKQVFCKFIIEKKISSVKSATRLPSKYVPGNKPH